MTLESGSIRPIVPAAPAPVRGAGETPPGPATPVDHFSPASDGTAAAVSPSAVARLFDDRTKRVQSLWTFDPQSRSKMECVERGPGDTLLVKTGTNRIYVLDAQKGTPRLVISEYKDHTCPPVGCPEGHVLVGDRAGRFHALDPATEQEAWSFQAGTVIAKPLLGPEGSVIVASHNGTVYSLDRKTGAKRWEYVTGMSVARMPAMGRQGTLFAMSMDGTIRAMDGKTGIHKGMYRMENPNFNTNPAVGPDETVFYGNTEQRRLYAVDAVSGQKKWEIPGPPEMTDPVVSEDGTVLFCGRDGKIFAVEGATGKPLWEQETGA